jgi:tungstate transport system substrate-binding protein
VRGPLVALLLLLAPIVAGCAAPLAGAPATLVLATTTSTENTGLLAYLLPEFEAAHHAVVKVVAVGTGRALELGRTGDADAVLAHAPATERGYLANGSFVERREVMFNQFLLVGPPGDPAGLRNATDVTAAFAAIQQQRAPFVSRGDNSGTHIKERELWAAAGINYSAQVLPANSTWYRSVGQGMEATLRIADQLQAYCLSDDGTFYAAAPEGLAIIRENEPPLRNQYSVLLVNTTRNPHTNASLALAFGDWMVSGATQARIAAFEVRGHQLFTPNAGIVERA